MKAPESTVRLAIIVKECGQPEPVTLWVDPQKDQRFQAAVRENRVMTIKQETVGTHKDFGLVGFHEEKNVSYWIFPKPLDSFEEKRVVGIDYRLLKEPSPSHENQPARRAGPTKGRRVEKSKPAKPVEPPKPETHAFQVTVRSVGTIEVTREVEARTAKDAGGKVLSTVAAEKPDFSGASLSRRVVRVKRM